MVKAHKQRPLAIAAFLHGVACHELTHLDGRMGEGHGEAFVAAREDLGHATGHLLPAIAVLVTKVLGLKLKPSQEQKQIAKLERLLARARSKAGGSARAEVRRLTAELEAARAELAQARAESARVAAEADDRCPSCRPGDAADRVIDLAVAAVRAAPPDGVDPEYLAGFVGRHRSHLRGLVQGAIERGRGTGT